MNTNNIIIREFTMDDYEQVVVLWQEAAFITAPAGGKAAPEWQKK